MFYRICPSFNFSKKISEKLFFLFWSVEQTTVAAFKMNLPLWMNDFGRKRILKQIEILTEFSTKFFVSKSFAISIKN